MEIREQVASRHCTDSPTCACVAELVNDRSRLRDAREEANLHIFRLERRVIRLRKKRDALRARLERLLRAEEELPHKRRNGQLYRFLGLALQRLSADDVEGASRLLAEALRLTPEQLDELAFKASLQPRNGAHPNGNHLKGPARNQAIRKRIRPSQRARIFDRDGRRCRMCGTQGDEKNPLTIDHVIPIVRGGTNNDTNLQTLCATCNMGRNKNEKTLGPPLDPGRDAIRPSFPSKDAEDPSSDAR